MIFIIVKGDRKMNDISNESVTICAVACATICLAGCNLCLLDGPIFIADTATGGASFASGAGAGATK